MRCCRLDTRQELLAERERLKKALARKMGAREAGMVEMTDELSMYDQHPADVGSELYEREKDAGLQENLEMRLVQVDRAMQRLAEGKYGTCERCGGTIDSLRLEALPEATLCVECARNEQDKFTRPEEERQTSMGDITEKGEWFNIAGYDFSEEYHKKFPDSKHGMG